MGFYNISGAPPPREVVPWGSTRLQKVSYPMGEGSAYSAVQSKKSERPVGSTIVPGAKIWNDVSMHPTGTLLRRRLPNSRSHGDRGRGTWRRAGQEDLVSGNVWHTDNQWMECPPWMTSLRAVSLPKGGGDTW